MALGISGAARCSLVKIKAIKVQALLPERPFRVDCECVGGKCQLMTLFPFCTGKTVICGPGEMLVVWEAFVETLTELFCHAFQWSGAYYTGPIKWQTG